MTPRKDDSDAAPDDGASDVSAIHRDWEIARKYHPNIAEVERQLRAMSHTLGFTFKLILLESKKFQNCEIMAAELERKYLGKYFGSDREGQRFAKELILEGRRDAAKALNDAVRVLGEASPIVIARIANEYKTARARNKDAPTNNERMALAMDIVRPLQRGNEDIQKICLLVARYSDRYGGPLRAKIVDEPYLLVFSVDQIQFSLEDSIGSKVINHVEAIEWLVRDCGMNRESQRST